VRSTLAQGAACDLECTITGGPLRLAYAAGLFEGEGSVAITHRLGRNARPQYMLVVAVKMGDPEPLAVLQSLVGGSVHYYKFESATELGRKPMHLWQVSARIAGQFLEGIEPYLQSERVRGKVKLGIAFQAQKRNVGRVVPTEYLVRQEQFYGAMRLLNKRGLESLTIAERRAILEAVA